MALPASGPISFNNVNVELGLSGTATISLNDAAVRTLFGVASGAIAMSNGYGKANQFAFNLTAGSNVDLRTQAINAGWNQSSKVIATLASGTISSSSTGSYALTISGSFPGGLEFINNGTITGRGGDGGNGSNNSPNNQGGPSSQSSTNGSGAGPALFVSTAVTITNNGSINGGGGGGGGGNCAGLSKGTNWFMSAGGGGGGGIGVSSGGAAGVQNFGGTNAVAGGAGTLTAAGSGGAGGQGGSPSGGAGGSGGSYGSSGANGGAPTGTARTGGAGGGAIVGNSNITWISFGTRNGSIS